MAQLLTSNTGHSDASCFLKMMADEAHCLLLGYVNRQTFSTCCQGNPSDMHKSPQALPPFCHSKCSVSTSINIGPHIFENRQQERVTLNARSDLGLLKNFLGPKMH
jgi:hypothetical protein